MDQQKADIILMTLEKIMTSKKFIKRYIHNQSVLSKIDATLAISEQRSMDILDSNDWYKELYINPDVDIVNSHPQVTQQVRKELIEFLELLEENGVKNMLQIGLGHWASTHFILSLLLDHMTTIEYDEGFIERYLPEMDIDMEKSLGDQMKNRWETIGRRLDLVELWLSMTSILKERGTVVLAY